MINILPLAWRWSPACLGATTSTAPARPLLRTFRGSWVGSRSCGPLFKSQPGISTMPPWVPDAVATLHQHGRGLGPRIHPSAVCSPATKCKISCGDSLRLCRKKSSKVDPLLRYDSVILRLLYYTVTYGE